MSKLLCLHGALSSRLQFDTLLPQLDKRLNAAALTFSGHGGLPIPPSGYTFQTFASDILHYADSNSIDRLNLFGYSMGGYAALYFAKLHPDRVEKIATLNVKFNWDVLSTARETAMLDAEKLIAKVPGYANQLMMLHGMQLWKEVLNQTANMMQGLAKDFVLTDEDFKQLRMPILIAVGDRDTTSSIEETLHIYQLLSQAQLWVIPQTPHAFEKVDTAELAKQLNRFY